MSTKKILITGAAGFVGANLTRELVRRGHRVHIIARPSSNLWRLTDLRSKLSLHRISLEQRTAVHRLVNAIQPEQIFHLAAYGGYPFQKDPYRIVQQNVMGTFHLLEALREVPYKSLVCAGSSSEYGFKHHPSRETDVLEPTHFYSAAKGSATLLVQTFSRLYKKHAAVLRLYSVYGPWEEPSRFIPTVTLNCLKGREVQLTPGNERRDFIFIEDVVRAFLLATSPRASGQVFNICTGRQSRVQDVGAQLVALSGRPVAIQKGAYPARSWDTTYWVGNPALAKRVLGWVPRYTLKKGLLKTMNWFKSHEGLYDSLSVTR